MQVDSTSLGTLLSDREQDELQKIVSGDQVVGYAVFDGEGAAVKLSGVSENSVAVFSNLMDIAERIGTELGESAPRPAMMFSCPSMELLALPLTTANFLVVKDRTSGQRKEFRHAH